MYSIWQHSLALSQGSIYRLIADASPFAKFILIVLLGFSVISWAIIIEKIRFFRAAERYSNLFVRRFREGAKLEELVSISRQTPRSPYSSLLIETESELTSHGSPNAVTPRGSVSPTTEDNVRVRSALNRAASTEISRWNLISRFSQRRAA